MKSRKDKPEKRFIRSFFQNNRLCFIVTVFLSALGGTSIVAASWLLGAVTDCMMAGDTDGLIRLAWITAAGVPTIGAVIWFGMRMKARFIQRAMTQYKNLAFSALCRKSISAFSRENTARYISALTNDAITIENQFLECIPRLVENGISFVMSIGVMLYCSPALTLVLIVASGLPILVSVIMSGRYAELEKQVSNENESYTAGLKDLLSGFTVIKSFKAEEEAKGIFSDSTGNTERVKEQKRSFAAIMSAAGNMSGIIAQLGTFIVGAFMAVSGHITPGTVMLFVNLCNGILGPIMDVPTCWANIRASLELIRKLAELTQENAERSGTVIPAELNDAIDLENLSFSYEEGKPVLDSLGLRMEAGKKYAIVGASGSGKTTLLNLLMGAYDSYSGSITIDGREMRGVDPDSLYELMSLIGQNVFLFDATIRENITMFRDFSETEVNRAAKLAGLDTVIAAKGKDYRCGENGVGLSGGERQRVSIARSLLRGSKILLLDEATAALDNQTAFEVTNSILNLDGLTRIVVTHRMDGSLLGQYDEIVVLRSGNICEQGTFEELMDRKGYFYSLYSVSN